MSVLIFLAVLFVLILVHEWGHYITAKWTGMKVEEFGIGFPPRLYGVKRGETEYTLNALPIGGFVRILQESGALEDVPEAERPRAFGARPKWAQTIVLLAGVTMNVLFAWLLFVVTFMIGVPTPVPESEAGTSAQLYVQDVIVDGPAAAVLPPGVAITSVTSATSSLETLQPTALTEFVSQTAPAPVTVEYMMGGESASVSITPARDVVAESPDRYLIGIQPVLVEDRSYSFLASIGAATEQTWNALGLIATGLLTLIIESISGTADYSQVAGPVGIVGMVGDAAAFGLIALLTFTAFISLNLAIINLLPFPALDGGRLVFVAIEAVTGKTIPPEWAGRVNLVGFALLMLLMIAVTYNDILRLVQ